MALDCSFVGGPCPRCGTPACADTGTVFCRNLRDKYEAIKEGRDVGGDSEMRRIVQTGGRP